MGRRAKKTSGDKAGDYAPTTIWMTNRDRAWLDSRGNRSEAVRRLITNAVDKEQSVESLLRQKDDLVAALAQNAAALSSARERRQEDETRRDAKLLEMKTEVLWRLRADSQIGLQHALAYLEPKSSALAESGFTTPDFIEECLKEIRAR